MQQQVGEIQKTAIDAQEQAGSAAQLKRKIDHLEEQMAETRKVATEAQGKTTVPGQLQPIAPVPAGALATHNFTLAGDAEVQFGRVAGQHSAFTFADFAPVFLLRAGDNVLFEAGLDISLQNGAVTLANGKTGNTGTDTTIDLSFATIDYLLNDYVTVEFRARRAHGTAPVTNSGQLSWEMPFCTSALTDAACGRTRCIGNGSALASRFHGQYHSGHRKDQSC